MRRNANREALASKVQSPVAEYHNVRSPRISEAQAIAARMLAKLERPAIERPKPTIRRFSWETK